MIYELGRKHLMGKNSKNMNWLVTKFLITNCNVNTIKERDMAILKVASHHLINFLTQQAEFENITTLALPRYYYLVLA